MKHSMKIEFNPKWITTDKIPKHIIVLTGEINSVVINSKNGTVTEMDNNKIKEYIKKETETCHENMTKANTST